MSPPPRVKSPQACRPPRRGRAPALPQPPVGYEPASVFERRLYSDETALIHNQRLGYVLRLAELYGLVPTGDSSLDARADLVRLLLPDDFPAAVDPAPYVAGTGDLSLALDIVGPGSVTVAAKLPNGQTLNIITTDPTRLESLQVIPDCAPDCAKPQATLRQGIDD